MNNQPKQQKSR